MSTNLSTFRTKQQYNINSRHQYPSQYMLPSYMQGSNGIIFNMNNFPPLSDQYTNEPMLPGVYKQYGAGPSDSYGHYLH
ncbi:unnamed protein product, partial [Rotaria sp. Silwood1]